LINLLCDRSLLGACAERTTKVTHTIVGAAAVSLELSRVSGTSWFSLQRRWALTAGALLIAIASTAAYAAMNQPRNGLFTAAQPPAVAENSTPAVTPTVAAQDVSPPFVAAPVAQDAAPVAAAATAATTGVTPPAAATSTRSYSIVVGSFRHRLEAESLSRDLLVLGIEQRAIRIRLVTGGSGAWHQVLAGPFQDSTGATPEYHRIRQRPGYADAQLIVH